MFASLRRHCYAAILLVFVLVLLSFSVPAAQAAPNLATPWPPIPDLAWNTFLGGSGGEGAWSVARDSGGNFYIAGDATADWGSPINSHSGSSDVFVAKLGPDGNLIWNTFWGGAGIDSGWDIAVDGSGNVYVTGWSSATWGSPRRAYSGGVDAIVLKLDSNGAFQWNTFLGQSGGLYQGQPGDDYGSGITIAPNGHILVAGWSDGSWNDPGPATGAGGAFVADLDANGVMQWNTFIGAGGSSSRTRTITARGDKIYLIGSSNSTWGTPIDPFVGINDAFVARLNSSGSIEWSTFLGGSADDYGGSLVLDEAGNIYVTGGSNSTWGTPRRAYTGPHDTFVAKLNNDGIRQWNTFFGGADQASGTGIVVDPSGEVIVAGDSAASWGTPRNPFLGNQDAFVAGLGPDGALHWNTFLGGYDRDEAYNLISIGNRQVMIVGYSAATWGSPLRIYSAGNDGFAAVLDLPAPPPIPNLAWNTFLGEQSVDLGWGMTQDAAGNFYIVGESRSTWGTPINPYRAQSDTFVAKLDPSGNLIWNTFFGGPGVDEGWSGIVLDESGNIYVSGWSDAAWGTPRRAYSGGVDTFVVKLDNNGILQWNTFLGSACVYPYVCDDFGYGIAVDGNGNALVSGSSQWTWETPINPHDGGSTDAFIAKLDDNGNVIWNTFIGGPDNDTGVRLTTDANGKVYLAGFSNAGWGNPVHPYNGKRDAFVTRLDSSGTVDWVSFFGGSDGENAVDLALDSIGNIYVIGESVATWGTPLRAFTGPNDNYVAKLDNNGHFLWNTFLGPTDTNGGYFCGITLDSKNNVAVTGTSGASWGTPLNPFAGKTNAFVAGLSTNGVLRWNTFLGGTDVGQATDLLASDNKLVLVGTSTSTWGSPLRPYTASYDAFVAAVNLPTFVDTNTTITSSANPSIFGQTVTFTATVQAVSGDATPTGTVTFYEQLGGNAPSRVKLGGMQLAASNSFTWTTSSLAVGTHNIVAEYSGDSNYAPSKSDILAQVVNAAQMPTRVSLTSSPNPSIAGEIVTLAGSVDTDSVDRFPTGDIVLYEILSGSPNRRQEVARVAAARTNGISAIWRISSLALGTHQFIAEYGGDAYFAPGKSPVLMQQVVENQVESVGPAIQWNGWQGKQADGASGKTYRVSKTTGDSVTFRFTGTAVTWLSYKGPDQGRATILIDGVNKGTLDLYNATPVWQWPKPFSNLANRAHTLVIKVAGSHNLHSSANNVVVDALQVSGSTYEESDLSVQYNNWAGKSDTSASDGSYRVNRLAGGKASLTFVGTSIKWITTKGKGYGIADVYIDGIKKGRYDLYYSGLDQWQQEIPFNGLTNARHTIEIRLLGTKNLRATGTAVIVDAFRGAFVLP